jgi:probable F420-dependent oxidoreductase
MSKIGIYGSIASPPDGAQIGQRLAEIMEEAVLAEACGFDSVFFGEHHQDPKGFLPSPLILAALAAGRTKTLRVGTNLLLLPLHHPVQVAEDAATLDVASNGRLLLGVGLGYLERDFDMFGVDKASRVGRFAESIGILRRCWEGEPFTHRGPHFQLGTIRASPRPAQRPGPPVWIGAVEPQAVERAGQLGDGWIIAPGIPLKFAAECAARYREEAARAGRPSCIVVMRDTWVAESREEARRVYGPEVVTAYQYYFAGGQFRLFEGIARSADISFDSLHRLGRFVLGTPDECVEILGRWREAVGADYFILRFRQAHSGGPPHAATMRAIEMFGAKVLPQLS